MSGLKRWMTIFNQILKGNDSEKPIVYSVCALSANELLVAMGAAGLRALSLRTGQFASGIRCKYCYIVTTREGSCC